MKSTAITITYVMNLRVFVRCPPRAPAPSTSSSDLLNTYALEVAHDRRPEAPQRRREPEKTQGWVVAALGPVVRQGQLVVLLPLIRHYIIRLSLHRS